MLRSPAGALFDGLQVTRRIDRATQWRHSAWQDGDVVASASGPCGCFWGSSCSDPGLGRWILLGGERFTEQTCDTPGEYRWHTHMSVQCVNIRPPPSRKHVLPYRKYEVVHTKLNNTRHVQSECHETQCSKNSVAGLQATNPVSVKG